MAYFFAGFEQVLIDAGVPYTLYPGWESRTADAYPDGFVELKGVMIHTTESLDGVFASGEDAPNRVEMANDSTLVTYAGPSTNVLIGRSGRCYLLAAGPSQHAGKGSWPSAAGPNPGVPADGAEPYMLGISMEANDAGYPVTQAQLESLIAVLCAIDREWGAKMPLVMHGEWRPLTQPGGVYDPSRIPGGWQAIRAARDASHWPTAATPAPAPAPSPGEAVDQTPDPADTRDWTPGGVLMLKDGAHVDAAFTRDHAASEDAIHRQMLAVTSTAVAEVRTVAERYTFEVEPDGTPVLVIAGGAA